MKKLIAPLAILAALIAMFVCAPTSSAAAYAPIPGFYSTTITNPCQCSDAHISVPAIDSTARWVQVEIATTNKWLIGVEGLGASSASGYLSWDYSAHGRFPYAYELGTTGDGYNEYTVYYGTLGNVDLVTQQIYCDIEKCQNDYGDPVGPFDGTDDLWGTSGGKGSDTKAGRVIGSACTDATVLAGLKAGNGLELNHLVSVPCVWGGGYLHAHFNPDPRTCVVTVTWGT